MGKKQIQEVHWEGRDHRLICNAAQAFQAGDSQLAKAMSQRLYLASRGFLVEQRDSGVDVNIEDSCAYQPAASARTGSQSMSK